MRRAALLVSCGLGLAGCFYIEPINQRPSLDIVPSTSDTVFRGDDLTLTAVAVDPEDELVRFSWRVYACSDALVAGDCDELPFATGLESTLELQVPIDRADGITSVASLLAVLEGMDARGATSKPTDQLILTVEEQDPLLIGRKVSRYEFVVGAPVELFVEYGDEDDVASNVSLAWTVFSPSGQPGLLDPITAPDPLDLLHLQAGMRLEPTVAGEWTVHVVATDADGNETPLDIPVVVVPDRPPCLQTPSPQVPPAGAFLPVTEPTLFEVTVSDDLDPFPHVADPLFRDPRFVWSIRPPGGPRQVLAHATSNDVVFDPATYMPGSLVEIRVEIADRNLTPITCADADPTCSVISTPSCLQRQTWLVEAR